MVIDPATLDVSSGPATGAIATNNADAVMLTNGPCRSIYVGVTGDIKVTMMDYEVVTFTNVPVGVLPIAARQVWSTGTTATGLIALY